MLIANPAAGGGRCRTRVEALGRDDVVWSAAPGDATRQARAAYAAGERSFIVAGGDGTVFEVLNGLFPDSDGDVTLGILPFGTGNSFVRDFGIDTPDAAIAALDSGHARPCDVIRCTHAEGELYFLNLLSVGFTARAGALTNRRFKTLGMAGYAVATVISLMTPDHPRFPYRTEKTEDGLDDQPCTLISFSNSQFTGGTMRMAPGADPTDGLLDIVFIGPMGRRRFLSSFPKIYQGTHTDLPEVRVATARRIDFEPSDPVDVMVDGEVLSLSLRSLEVLHNAVRVLVPDPH